MTGVQTEWHLAELASAEADPFATVVYSTGVTLDLNATEGELAEQFIKLLEREGRMYANGLTCQLKWDGQDCLTCPQATLDPEEKRSRLCRLGKDQSATEKRMNSLADARLAPIREMVAMSEELGELGEIPDDLSELLTAVGL